MTHSSLIFCLVNENSSFVSGLVLLRFFVLRFLLQPFDVTITSQSAFSSFDHAISTEVRAWRHLSLLVERFCWSFEFGD